MRGSQRPGQTKAESLVTRARNVEKTSALFLKGNFSVVETTRYQGQTVISQ